MKRNVYREGLGALAVGVSVSVLAVLLLVLVAGCSRDTWHAPLALANDSTAARLGLPPARKYKFTGPVTFTVQHGNSNVASPTTTGKTKATAAAIGPGSSAAATPAATPWWVYGLVALSGAALLAWVQNRCGTFAKLIR
ncbi:hypothetical protein GCM10027594_35890 [Hymenobacter agri]